MTAVCEAREWMAKLFNRLDDRLGAWWDRERTKLIVQLGGRTQEEYQQVEDARRYYKRQAGKLASDVLAREEDIKLLRMEVDSLRSAAQQSAKVACDVLAGSGRPGMLVETVYRIEGGGVEKVTTPADQFTKSRNKRLRKGKKR